MKLLPTMLHAGPMLAQAAHGILDISHVWCSVISAFLLGEVSMCIHVHMRACKCEGERKQKTDSFFQSVHVFYTCVQIDLALYFRYAGSLYYLRQMWDSFYFFRIRLITCIP